MVKKNVHNEMHKPKSPQQPRSINSIWLQLPLVCGQQFEEHASGSIIYIDRFDRVIYLSTMDIAFDLQIFPIEILA